MKEIVRRQLTRSIETMQKVREDEALLEAIVLASTVTAETMMSGRKLLVAGNGGSVADAQHLVAEFVARLTVNRPALRAIALTTDSSILTAIGNDFAYENVFERQIEALGQPGDVFLGISTSGNSGNIVKALELARGKGITTIGYSGNGGGKMAALCDINVIIPSSTTMNIQESHLALEHIFRMMVEICCFGPDFGGYAKALGL